MTRIRLADVIILDDSATRGGGRLSPVGNSGYMDLTVDYVLDPLKTYVVEMDIEAKFNTGVELWVYSAIGPTQAQVDESMWYNLGSSSNPTFAQTTLTVSIGPGLADWDSAVAAGEHYIILEPEGFVTGLRIRESGTDEPPGSTGTDFPCTYVWPKDNATYPWTSSQADDWNPPQYPGVYTNWGYLVPDSGCLTDREAVLGDIWDTNGYLISRSHGVFGADFDPARSILLSLGNPGVYGPPPGQIEADGSITWFSDPSDPTTGHWSDDDPMIVKFEGSTPTGISLTDFEVVTQSYAGGGTPRLWFDWQTDGVHRSAFISLTNDGTYAWRENKASLPADFPIQDILDGVEFTVHFTIYGGFWYGMFSYLAFRFYAEESTQEYGRLKVRTDDGWKFVNPELGLGPLALGSAAPMRSLGPRGAAEISRIMGFENYGTHEGKPENGVGATLVGSGDIWRDGSNGSYATLQYSGFEDPWGHPYARVVDLPLTRAEADQVTDIIVTWTARLAYVDPTDVNAGSESSVSPILRWGQGEEGSAGPSYGSLGTEGWWGSNSRSLAYSVNPTSPWEEYYLPPDGSWKTMSERLTAPLYAYGLTWHDILCNDFSNATFTRNSPEFGGTQDHLRLYCIIFQESFWSEERFEVSEIKIELKTLPPLVESFSSGSDGSAISTTNTVFTSFDFDPPADQTSTDLIFSNAQSHSSSLSMTGADNTYGDAMYWPPVIGAAVRDDYFWFYFTGNSGLYSSIFSILYGTLGESYDWNIEAALAFVGGGEVGDMEFHYSTDTDSISDTFTVPENTWLKATHHFDPATRSLSFKVESDSTIYYELEPVVIESVAQGWAAYAFRAYGTGNANRPQVWIDDINYVAADSVEYGRLKVRTDDGWKFAYPLPGDP